jgi:hypothetical protein
MRHYLLAVISCFFLGLSPALANNTQKYSDIRAAVESSLTVEGDIEINSKGDVQKVTLSQRDKLADDIASFVEKRVSTWKFQPVLLNGEPVAASSKMSVFLIAKKNSEGGHSVRIASASFNNAKPGEVVSGNKLLPPKFPREALHAGARSTVYLAVRVGQNGEVIEAAARRVDMRVLASPSDMKKLRDMFAQASIKAARNWTFTPPTTGDSTKQPYWTVFVPVEFAISDGEDFKPIAYGQWDTYVRGPSELIPWPIPDGEEEKLSALTPGSAYQLGSGLQLLTPMN